MLHRSTESVASFTGPSRPILSSAPKLYWSPGVNSTRLMRDEYRSFQAAVLPAGGSPDVLTLSICNPPLPALAQARRCDGIRGKQKLVPPCQCNLSSREAHVDAFSI